VPADSIILLDQFDDELIFRNQKDLIENEINNLFLNKDML
jgi:hypothetical protein